MTTTLTIRPLRIKLVAENPEGISDGEIKFLEAIAALSPTNQHPDGITARAIVVQSELTVMRVMEIAKRLEQRKILKINR
jgi:hypothetical protein